MHQTQDLVSTNPNHIPNNQHGISGRVELAKRQDWTLEVSENVWPILPALLGYLTECLQLDKNILRDSILQGIELMHHEAYIQTCALMWTTVYGELRALTNSTIVNLNPLELNFLYDNLWNVAETLKGPSPLSILDQGWRPWPKVRLGDPNCESFYRRLESNIDQRKQRLRSHETKEDLSEYTVVLKETLALFGAGIQDSLTRTMGQFLEATGGTKRNSNLEDWERVRYSRALCHNNFAERPFATMKELHSRFPSMKLRVSAALSHAKNNGTFRMAETGGKCAKTKDRNVAQAGEALTCDPRLQSAISAACSIRVNSLGPLTKLMRQWEVEDNALAAKRRKKKNAEELAEASRLAAGRAERVDRANEVQLIKTVSELRLAILALEGKKKHTVTFLKEQYSARVINRKFAYPKSAIGDEFRSSKTGKLRIGSPPGRGDVEYLQELVEKMIEYDATIIQDDGPAAATAMRILDPISQQHASAASARARRELEAKLAKKAAPTDDPILLELMAKYQGKHLYNFECDKPATYRVEEISYVENKNNQNPPCWEATCVEVEKGEDNEWTVNL